MREFKLRQVVKMIVIALGLVWLWICLMGATGLGVDLSGQITGEEWLGAAAADKLAYCQKAYRSFRNSPSQSYIISSNVQALTPESFCSRLDQFYAYELNLDIPLNQASGIAPLLFADQPSLSTR